MTMPDLPERPGLASETREMVERGRTGSELAANVSGRAFVIALVVIIAAIVAIALLVR